ncbi:acetyltransferase [Bacillus horti]|uniref:Acetyltransferase EpsM n=1 Tax=Caldalkalibacillus horti TaxID=77523 RepID=A0ABT9VZE1_9BACI|nr:acetyltransferase [Bacillus horti]MDQ0166373.1 acetyltransferase EpsM [Bacillus horti]
MSEQPQQIILLGDGGHSRVIQDIIALRRDEYELVGILDDKYTETSQEEDLIRGPIRYATELAEILPHVKFVVGIGNNHVRKLLTIQLDLPLERYVSLLHPSAMLSSSVTLGRGTVVMANAVLNANASVGQHAIINSSTVVEHDCVVEDFVHLSPKVALAGGVKVEEGSHLGIGCVAIPGQQIGKWSTVGAGASVTSHIPSFCTAIGIPAKPIKTHQL